MKLSQILISTAVIIILAYTIPTLFLEKEQGLAAINYDSDRNLDGLLGANDNIISYNYEIVASDGASTTAKAYGGHTFFKDDDKFYRSDIQFEDMGEYWRMVKHNYKLFIAKDFSRQQLIRYDNVFEGANHTIYYEPKMLAWVNNPDMSDMQVFRNQQAVIGHIINDEGTIIRYDDAFGTGIHFEITLNRDGFKKEIVIDAKDKLELPPTANHKLVALFKYEGQGLKIKSKDELREWNKVDFFEETAGFRIQEEANEVYQSFIRPAYIIDEGAEVPVRENIKVFWKLYNGSLWQAKVLPKQFLLNATYPIRADTITDYDPTGGDGSIYYNNSTTNWDTVHDSTDGGSNVEIQTAYIGVQARRTSIGTYLIKRGFFPIDTSALPAGYSVSSATAYLYNLGVQNGVNDAYDWITLIAGTTQASTNELVSDDYDQCGSINNPTEGIDIGDRLNYWGLSTGWKTFDLNSTGIGVINDSVTKLGFRDGHDVADVAISGSNVIDGINFYSGTNATYPPYLKITYTVEETAEPKRTSEIIFN